MADSDPECEAKGIPAHLHQVGRPPDREFNASEELYRRYLLSEADLTATIKFTRMSVLRGKHCESADDALWDDKNGRRHEGFGVVTIRVGALQGSWRHPELPLSYSLVPEHRPERCNFPHSEIVTTAFEAGAKTPRPLKDLKPSSVKLQIREHLQSHVRVVIPSQDAGQALPVERGKK